MHATATVYSVAETADFCKHLRRGMNQAQQTVMGFPSADTVQQQLSYSCDVGSTPCTYRTRHQQPTAW